MKIKYTILVALLFVLTKTKGQDGVKNTLPYPVIGKPMLDFRFTDLINYPKKEAKLSDFKGKWLILDFWGYSCSGCLASFPEMNRLSEKFKDSVKIIMVGSTKGNGGKVKEAEIITKRLYKFLEKKYDLKFTVAFDSILMPQYKISSLPHQIIIDPNGIVRNKTFSITEKDLDMILRGEMPIKRISRSEGENSDSYNFKASLPLLTSGNEGNGGNDTSFFYRSLLTKWNRLMPINYGTYGSLELNENGRFEWWGIDFSALVRLAMTGKYIWYRDDSLYQTHGYLPVLLVKDTAMFQRANQTTGEGMYSYSLVSKIKKHSTADLQHILKTDLENAFDIKITIEEREAPVWKLLVKDKNILKKHLSNSKTSLIAPIGEYEGVIISGSKMSDILSSGILLESIYDEKTGLRYPIIDETGNNSLYDITLKCYMKDYQDVRKELNKNGLDFVKGTKIMKVAVVKDRK